jgi:ribonuclease HI
MIDVSTHNSVGLFWVFGHSGVRGNEIADELAKEGTVQQFVGPEPALGVSRNITRRKIKPWIDSLHMAMWH